VFQFDRGILSSEAPIDGDLLLIAASGPGSDLLASQLKGG